MKTAAIQYAVAIGLAGVLALAVVTAAGGQIGANADGRVSVAQFCIPPDTADAHRYYCRHGG